MAVNLMVVGTMSSAGKSYIVTGLCRYFSRLGYKVAPFKSQNMALNSFVTKDGLEMGRAQVVQAEAAGVEPCVYMNPILLKPTTDVGSQVIVEGKSIGNMRAREYFDYKTKLIPNILKAYKRLESENDIIIIEGAGSPAEINLKSNDIVNMGLAKLLDAPVILVGDIDTGGVFAQLHGTYDLLLEDEQERIKGMIINKFRGDVSLLTSGIQMLEELTKKPVLGVVPMSKAKIEEEDSITSAFNREKNMKAIEIAIIRLPRISNFTDFDIFKIIEDVNAYYVTKPSDIGNPDLIIIPGTKSTISDLRWMKSTGLDNVVKGFAKEIPVIGICGGYQMLGDEIADPLEIEGGGIEKGLGLINMKTVLEDEKILTQKKGIIDGARGLLSVLNGLEYVGYEIHNGRSEALSEQSAGDVFGTYVHGIFDNAKIADVLIKALASRKGLDFKSNTDYKSYKMMQYDIIADELAASCDFDAIAKIMGL